MKRDIIRGVRKLKRMFDRKERQPKIFCVGRNKTGTTSLARSFRDLGYEVGNQRKAELLLDEYIKGNFSPIIQYCKSAQVFQDVPFSYPGTYQHLHAAYPEAKFILTVRDSAEQWYHSLVKFHAKLFGKGHIPSAEDLREATYVHKGWMWKANRAVYDTPEADPYRKNILLKHYEHYNQEITEYFKGTDQLLILNISAPESYQKFCDFLGIRSPYHNFPWENKTEKIEAKI